MTQKKQVKKKTTKLAVKKDSNKLMWAGGGALLSKSTNKDIIKARDYIQKLATYVGVSPMGITVLGGQPYLNKLARKQKLKQYGKGKWRVKYDWIQIAKDDTEKAICNACVVNEKGEELSSWVMGECSPASVKMSTLAGYQNHMAQTRAYNRVIEEFIGADIHEEMIERIGKFMAGGEKIDIPAIDTSVSAEEIVQADTNGKAQTKKEDFAPEAECGSCGNAMTKIQAEASKKLFKKQLCNVCQAEQK